jgi:hypothetical protein
MQVDAASMEKLAHLNGTIFGGSYLLDVNPNYAYRSIADWKNVIDARFIHIKSGCFIDLTVIVPVTTFQGVSGYTCKSPHFFTHNVIFPLHPCLWEGSIPVWRPNSVIKLLTSEYGQGAMQKVFESYNNDKIEYAGWDSMEKYTWNAETHSWAKG